MKLMSKRIGPSWLVLIALLSLFLLVIVTFVNRSRSEDRLKFMFPITMESIQFQWLNWGSADSRKETEIRIQPARQQMTCIPCSTLKKNASISAAELLPIIYVITPTYRRPEQMAELVRLAQTLMHIPAIHWIVVEDADSLSKPVIDLLARLSIPSTHLYAPMPAQFRTYKYLKPRGVSNRNAAMDFIRKNVKSGVFYFADDDNSYDIRLFDEMRFTKKVSMWPVGLIPRYGVSSPVLNEDGQVVDFYDSSSTGRMFAVDMASFAVNIQFLLQRPNATMPFIAGLEEDGFLQSLNISLLDIEAKADRCTQIMVWHTKSQLNPLADRRMMKLPRFTGNNIDKLQALII